MKILTILTVRRIQWLIYFTVLLFFFIWIYRVNNQFSRDKIQPMSAFEKTRDEFDQKLKQLPIDQPVKTLYSSTVKDNIPDFKIDYPATWSARFGVNDDNHALYVLIPSEKTEPATSAGECIRVYQNEDHMPVLEAKNYSPVMLESPDLPFFTKDDVETVINGMDAIVSRIRLDSKKPERFVFNAVLVIDNHYSYILRTCEDTKDSIFYQVLKSFSLI